MSSVAVLHLIIPRGVDFIHTVELLHGLVLTEDLSPGSALINIQPLPIDLPANFTLKFVTGSGTTSLVTTAVTLAGATTVQVMPYTGLSKLVGGVVAKTLPKDLTGQIWKGQVRRTYTDIDPLIELDFTISPLNGLITIKAPKSKTLLLPPNSTYSELPTNNLDRNSGFTENVWRQGYVWDCEYALSGTTYRAFQGRVWVSWDVTK